MKYLVLCVLVGYVLLCGALYIGQEHFLFFPVKTEKDHIFRYKAEEVLVEAGEGIALHGLWFKAPSPIGLMLYFHGNAGNLEGWGSVCEDFVRRHYDCLIFDYRGYGKSDGRINSQKQWFEDGERILSYAKKVSEGKPMILYGRSIGTSVASYLAGEHSFEKVILEASPWSFVRLAQENFPIVPLRVLFRFPFENHRYLERSTSPTLFVHGTRDSVIPFAHFQALRKAFEGDDHFQFSEISGGDHNDLVRFKAYREVVDAFLERGD